MTMNERYLFRGKRIDNGEWVEGFLTKQRHSPKDPKYSPPYELEYVIDHEDKGLMFTSFIDPATVGQCTGLRDKNGELIFEGDILRVEISKSWSGRPFGHLLLVEWRRAAFTHKVIDQYGDAQLADYFAPETWSDKSEITGNKYDTPEGTSTFGGEMTND